MRPTTETARSATELTVVADLLSDSAGAPNAATLASPVISTPFTECPAIGADASCAVLIEATNSATNVYDDPAVGPFDGVEDTLVGVVNNSSRTLRSLSLSSNTDMFGFDADGICSGAYGPWTGSTGCPYGSTGYEGPGVSFSNIPSNSSGGIVNFAGGVAPGHTEYFSLEERLTARTVIGGGPTAVEQGGAPNPSQHFTTCSTASPVNCATGDFWHEFTDFAIPGRGVPLSFSRTYSSNLASVNSSLGFGWSDLYDMSLSVDGSGNVTVTQENGSTVTFNPTGGGSFSAAPRVLASLVQNGDGSYTFSRFSDSIAYNFSSGGQLLSQVDRNGYTTTLAYTGSQLTAVTDPAGRKLTFTYNGSHLTSIVDPLGRTVSFSYDGLGNLIRATDPAGNVTAFHYDPNHLLTAMTDANGNTVANICDSSNRVISQTDGAGRATTWSYSGDPNSPVGSTTTMTDPNGNVTLYDYANLELNDVTHAFGTGLAATTSYTYDPSTLGVDVRHGP